ncbi:nicotinamide riboside transporter PnuC [Thiorhodovibrio frisius]|uniref:Nicotinamide riboside transporter PnuC n=1 Tax=Thiorhodovibrio frisius TaxID=631362 RepID=H8Z4T3_9GAMM|nr:nicotinamide riboside transporter PnuC [Thiorhodovibrio frisius]EIC20340.1 nicotinamide mononucleotide transporter PnuC [Thiorhodovibrio frisius]WPL21078.1 Nicotinamide riboside transporter PnuC [Thiorhodovibrio frisius]
MTGIEATAVVFGFLCVWLTIRQNIWCWPAGLVQVVLYLFIFYQIKLYSDMLLHGIYVVMQLYGWYWWLHGSRERSALAVSRLQGGSRFAWPLLVIVASLLWGHLMATQTDAALPYADAFTTVASLVAQWLLARKKLESWLFWITVDLAAIAIYWHKDLYLTAGLYATFLVMAVFGLLAWHRSQRERQAVPQPA